MKLENTTDAVQRTMLWSFSHAEDQLLRVSEMRKDSAAVLIVIGLALVAAMGLAAAWYISCRNQGMYPALDMPSFQEGGTWKAYCTP